jgi:hypothetical protein
MGLERRRARLHEQKEEGHLHRSTVKIHKQTINNKIYQGEQETEIIELFGCIDPSFGYVSFN